MANPFISNNWFVIIDITEPDSEKCVNCTFDTVEGAVKLMELYEKNYPARKFKLFKEAK